MIGTYAVIAGTLLLAGMILGLLVVIALGIHREKTALTSPPRDRLVGGVRVITGLGSRTPSMVREVGLPQQLRRDWREA